MTTSTVKSDSLKEVRQYVTNARAVLDSLSHYEFLKVRAVQLRTDLQNSQAEKLGLKLQLMRAQVSVDSTRRNNESVALKLKQTQDKLKVATTENWVWRSAGFLLLLDLTTKAVTIFK